MQISFEKNDTTREKTNSNNLKMRLRNKKLKHKTKKKPTHKQHFSHNFHRMFKGKIKREKMFSIIIFLSLTLNLFMAANNSNPNSSLTQIQILFAFLLRENLPNIYKQFPLKHKIHIY